MKSLLFILGVITAMAGCKDTSVKPSNIIGTWELRHYSGTIAGVNKELPKGNGTLLKFNADSTYQHFSNFKVENNGRFKIVKNGIDWGNEKYDAIYLGESGDANIFSIRADSLVISNTYADGVTSVYMRKD